MQCIQYTFQLLLRVCTVIRQKKKLILHYYKFREMRHLWTLTFNGRTNRKNRTLNYDSELKIFWVLFSPCKKIFVGMCGCVWGNANVCILCIIRNRYLWNRKSWNLIALSRNWCSCKMPESTFVSAERQTVGICDRTFPRNRNALKRTNRNLYYLVLLDIRSIDICCILEIEFLRPACAYGTYIKYIVQILRLIKKALKCMGKLVRSVNAKFCVIIMWSFICNKQAFLS